MLLRARGGTSPPYQLTPEAKLPERDGADPGEGDDHAWRHVPAAARRMPLLRMLQW